MSVAYGSNGLQYGVKSVCYTTVQMIASSNGCCPSLYQDCHY